MNAKIIRLLAVVIGILALLLSPIVTGAQEESTTGSGLRVAPLRSELVVAPGKNDEVKVKAKNVADGPVVVRSLVVDFKPNEDGTPTPLSQSEDRLPTSIRDFLEPEDGVLLEAGEEHDYVLPLEVPLGTNPGVYYGLVLFQAIPADQATGGPSQVSLTASIAHVVIVEVPGDVIEKLQILSVKAARQSAAKNGVAAQTVTGSLFSNSPNQILLALRNEGSSLVKPFGNITIQDWRGNQISSTEINNFDPKANVLPENERVFSIPITEVKGVGRFTVLASVGYGNGNEVISLKTTFWVLPLWLIGAVAAISALLVFMAVKLIKSRRRR